MILMRQLSVLFIERLSKSKILSAWRKNGCNKACAIYYQKCFRDNAPISNLQLQKILYFIQVEFLKNFNCICFHDEIEAWMFGPVVPVVYREYQLYGALPIKIDYTDTELLLKEFAKKKQNKIDDVINIRKKQSAWDMVHETHKKGKAWDKIYRNGDGAFDIIPICILKEFG